MKFTDMTLSSKLQKALKELEYNQATQIQEQAIPLILANHDLMGRAKTGTGKTAAFALPILNKLIEKDAKTEFVSVLVLAPTRELVQQIYSSFVTYGKHTELKVAAAFGGVSINPQIKAIKQGVDILVATPGRLLDLYQQKCIDFRDVEVLILDEADRMLDMGFIRDIKKIMALLPKQR